MKSLLLILLVWAAGFNSDEAFAQSSNGSSATFYTKQTLGLTTHVNIVMSDQVTGNCWTNSFSVESRAKLLFEQNGVSVVDYEILLLTPFNYSVVISAFGERTGNGLCYASAQVKTIYYASERYWLKDDDKKFTLLHRVQAFAQTYVAVSSTNLNDQISDFVDGALSELMAKIISARRDPDVQRMKAIFPNYQETPTSREDIVRMLK